MHDRRAPARARRLAALPVAVLLAVAALGLGPGRPGPAAAAVDPDGGPRVLVFTRTAEYDHASIPRAVTVIRALGDNNGFAVDDTADPTAFTPANLARYRAVVWLSTTGDVLDPTQQAAFEGFIRHGGGYAGVHAASHTEHDWPWYGELLGAWFGDVVQEIQQATVVVEDHVHPSTAGLPAHWVRTDEWYDFERNPRGDVHVLATLDESTYDGGGMGADHPIAWCHGFQGGRSWYTAGGHTGAAYDEPFFRRHLLHGILWAAGLEGGACGGFVTPDPPAEPAPPTPTTPTPAGAAHFVPLPPERILDTRTGLGLSPAAPAPLGDDGVLDLAVAGRAGVPAGAVAVALTLTATEAAGAGYVTAWPTGGPRPPTSTVNVDEAGRTVANLAVVPLGAGGQVSLYAQRGTHLLADVSGYWVPSGPVASGRLVPVQPVRLLDTREALGAPAGPVPSGAEVAVRIAGAGGLPSAGIGAVALTLTATGTTAPGYVSVWGDGPRPLVSNLNVDGPGQTVANLVVVPVASDGTVRVFAQSATHLVADVAGWFTDATAAAAGDGLLVPVTPTRFLDTRLDAPVDGTYGVASLPGGEGRELVVAGRSPLPGTGVAAVLGNVTATGTSRPGYVTVHPAGATRPSTSNLNVDRAGQTVANLVVGRLGTGGRLGLFSQEPLDLVVDVAGWFTAPTG